MLLQVRAGLGRPYGEPMRAGAALFDKSRLAPDRLRVSVFLLLAFMFVLLAAFSGVTLWLHRDAYLRDGTRRAENLALILGDHLKQTVGSIDTALTQLALHSQRVGGPHSPPPAWRPVLEATIAGLPGVGSLSVVDDQGIITHSTLNAILGQSRRELYSFRQLSTDAISTIVAETPFRSLLDGRYLIPLAKRLQNAEQFEGIVVATMEPERLRYFYRSIDVGHKGIVSVLHPEGFVLFREPSPENPIGEIAIAHPILEAARSGAAFGFIRQALYPGGDVHLSAFRALENPALIVAVSLDERDVLANWWQEVLVSAGIVFLVGLAMLYAGYRLTREMSARAASDTALEKSRVHFQEMMDNAPLEIAVKDLEGRYMLVNRAFERRHGLAPGQCVGKSVADLIPKKSADIISESDREVAEKKIVVQREISITFPGGTRLFLVTKFPLFDAQGEAEAVGVFATDITDQKRAEAELAHAQKMEAIGQLTGGIAHDFNNLLTVILGSAEMLATRPQGEQDFRTLAKLTMEAAEKGAALTQRLLAFGRRQTLKSRPTDVNALLAGMEQLLRRTIGENINIEHIDAPDLWAAMVDPGQLETAVINLAVNARDAMPKEGRLISKRRMRASTRLMRARTREWSPAST